MDACEPVKLVPTDMPQEQEMPRTAPALTEEVMVLPDTLLLSARDVERCVSVDDAIDLVEGVFIAHGRGTVSMPPKIGVDMARFGNPNWFNAMPAFVPSANVCGIKWSGGALGNPGKGLPLIVAMLILNDPETAVPLAVMDATSVTRLRTGAVAAVAVKRLAHSTTAISAAILGAGTQGRAALTAITHVTEITEARVFDVSREAAEAFVRDLGVALGLRIVATPTAETAVRGAHLIVTATTADHPLFEERSALPGSLVVAIGSYPELAPELLARADRLIVDNIDQNLHRGQLARALAAGHVRPEDLSELGDVLVGRRPGRERASERIVACLIGMATEDMAVAAHVYRRALRDGIGKRFAFL